MADSFDPFQNPSEARAWLGRLLEKLGNGKAQISTAEANCIFKGFDTWCRVYKLEIEGEDLRQIQADLDEVRRLIGKHSPRLVEGS